jgi:tetratricopeptide (TPR) repeat protein
MIPALKAEEKYNEITALISLIQNKQRFCSASDFEWRRIESLCKKLLDVRAVDGWTLLAFAYALIGNVCEVKRCLKNAEDLGFEAEDLLNGVHALMFLGCFDDALEILKRNQKKFESHLTVIIEAAYFAGGIIYASELVEKAKRMNIELPQDADNITITRNFMEQFSLSDSLINHHLNLAGKVLREFAVSGNYKIEVNDVVGVFQGLTISIGVVNTMDEIFKMNFMLATLEDRENIEKIPQFDVVFSSSFAE